MSRFRRERWVATVSPTAVGVTRFAPGRRPTVLESVRLDLPAGGGWQAPVDALSGWLAERRGSRANFELVVGGAFCRVALLPWEAGLSRREERMAYARMRFEDGFGTMDGWAIEVAEPEYGRPQFACAIEAEFLAAIRRMAEENGIRLCSVRPAVVEAVNRCAPRISETDALLLVVESAQVTLATFRESAWASVRATFPPTEPTAWRQLVDRELVLQGLDAGAQVFGHAADPAASMGAGSIEGVTWLDAPERASAVDRVGTT